MFGQLFQAGLASEYSALNRPVLEIRSSREPLNWRRIMSTEFTKTVCGDSLLEELSIRSMILLLKIEGNCSHLRAKSAYFVCGDPNVGESHAGMKSTPGVLSRRCLMHDVCFHDWQPLSMLWRARFSAKVYTL